MLWSFTSSVFDNGDEAVVQAYDTKTAAKLEAMEYVIALGRSFTMQDVPECNRCESYSCKKTCWRAAIRQCWDEDLITVVGHTPLKYEVTLLGREVVKKGQMQREEMALEAVAA